MLRGCAARTAHCPQIGRLGHEHRLQARVVNYADDFMICCRGTVDEAAIAMRSMMARLKLTINERKTKQCRAPEQTFDFLGTLGLVRLPQQTRHLPWAKA